MRSFDGSFSLGGKRRRVFEPGNLKLLVLHKLSSGPSYGYEIMRKIEEKVGGGYSPSPGIIYPILSTLEDISYIYAQSEQEGRKQYGITKEGELFLKENKDTLERILARLEKSRHHQYQERPPEIQRAIYNVKMALYLRLQNDNVTPEIIQKIATLLDQTAINIERL